MPRPLAAEEMYSGGHDGKMEMHCTLSAISAGSEHLPDAAQKGGARVLLNGSQKMKNK
ncbi:DNA polymerase III subunit epsilon [Anopheles sinensis]|uniref:DNA polymerase III subunit epsilon n=1 Tax=Anopheles sinensis TaxID=74873 RepID=A0A084VIT5_ANOSI|nr:DNA polymerase III subunit epsilon [Anopheles sinensis]